MKAIFIVSAICVFLSLFWLAYYTYQKFEVQDYKESKRDIFLLVASILIILCSFIALLKISLVSSLIYIFTLLAIYLFLLSIIYHKFEKDQDYIGYAIIFLILSILVLLILFFMDFREREEIVSTEEIELESSDYSTENILIINLRKSNDKINEFCIMKHYHKDMPLELSYSDLEHIQIVEKGNEKLEINKVAHFSYDLLAYFGFKEATVTEDFYYSLYINEDSIKYK